MKRRLVRRNLVFQKFANCVLSRRADLKETRKVSERVELRQQVLRVLVKEVMVVIPEMETGNYETLSWVYK